ncbi:hypothetical protein GDO81_016916 [Engystomops pustulosus]|uniref:Uncharacterized protein n=1 Tax=Engystomops pustulosus TaxID=76066 RepID=A0AAV7AE78_ENGPU|nr:hypothetical protein GDO81_016916 [Engystomops pustulosus]
MRTINKILIPPEQNPPVSYVPDEDVPQSVMETQPSICVRSHEGRPTPTSPIHYTGACGFCSRCRRRPLEEYLRLCNEEPGGHRRPSGDRHPNSSYPLREGPCPPNARYVQDEDVPLSVQATQQSICLRSHDECPTPTTPIYYTESCNPHVINIADEHVHSSIQESDETSGQDLRNNCQGATSILHSGGPYSTYLLLPSMSMDTVLTA